MSSPLATPAVPAARPLSGWTTLLLAVACGIIVANLYYAQPLIGPISSDLNLAPEVAGVIVTLTQIGYVLGLLFLVPLGDRLENRKLVVGVLMLTAGALAVTAFARSTPVFLVASIGVGLGSVVAQILVPFAANLAPEATRGRVVGNVMSGLFAGIMLARPIASLVADMFGWHAVFAGSAIANLALAVFLLRTLPRRQPQSSMAYPALLRSMWDLLCTSALLRRRAVYHVFAFGTFSLFWTTVPLLLASPAFGMSQTQIALFALAGVAGAVAAPVAGRLADRGLVRSGTFLALGLVAAALVLAIVVPPPMSGALAALVVTAIVIDMGVSANLILSQRVIFSIGADVRSRVNGVFMALFFAGGAAGSTLGVWTYAHGGWMTTLWVALALPVLALLYAFTDKKR
ncbi:MFS transporter [Pigmentiphaga litoralis]|uniref:MFS transporter n=1 Tax=Pigmentiphaga litoralis TaxID=516702 RepID=UPI001678F52D|nr:MFS transporter [Pigmentiphaga litoralis]